MTMSMVRPDDDLRGYVSDQARKKIMDATAQERATSYMRGTGGKLDLRTMWATTMTFMNPEFEATRWKIINSSPDQIIMLENGKQATVLNVLSEAFGSENDASIAEQYCEGTTCTACLEPEQSCDCPTTALERPTKTKRRRSGRGKKKPSVYDACPCVSEKGPGECYVKSGA